jgi:GntR family transcriptional regulator, transcriptional repressor for pyruvate dehydrogenase complex
VTPDAAVPSPATPAVRSAVGWRWMGSDEPLFLRVADQIERYIEGNGMSHGARLPGERELSELLGVSRASVREALRSLQTRGVVAVRHGKGVFVASPAEGERAMQRFARLREVGMEELFAMREVLEVPAAGWAATAATDEQLQLLVATFERLEQAVLAHSSPNELQAMDAQLHLQIAEFASNRFLAMTQTVLQEMLARSMDTTLAIAGRPARSVREHSDIVAALLARDANRARAAARRHIHSARRAALRRVASERAVAAPPLTPGQAGLPAAPPGSPR